MHGIRTEWYKSGHNGLNSRWKTDMLFLEDTL